MPHMRLRCEFHDGRTLEVSPTTFEPLTAAQLEHAIQYPGAPLDLAFHGIDAVVDGEPVATSGRVTTKVTFPHSPAPYALVARGWLPMPFATPQHFLVDRNVVAILKSIRARGPRPDDASFVWWTQLFEGATSLFNPLLYAYEGQYRRTPTMEEFITAFHAGVAELQQSFPRATVVQYEQQHFESAFEQLQALDACGSRDTQFLLKAIPLVLHRVPRKREQAVQAQVLNLARDLGVLLSSPIVLAVLSVLYEDVHGIAPSYGRRLLKPTASYTAGDAYNAVSDLRHIELAALSQAVLPDKAFALCTSDRGIALFWSALECRGVATEDSQLSLWYSLGTDLLPRLSEVEVKSVMQALTCDA